MPAKGAKSSYQPFSPVLFYYNSLADLPLSLRNVNHLVLYLTIDVISAEKSYYWAIDVNVPSFWTAFVSAVWKHKSETEKHSPVLGGSVPAIFDWDCRYNVSVGPLLDMLGWDRVSVSWTKQKAVVMFKSSNKQMPPYMQDMFSVRDFHYSIRHSKNILHVPKQRTDYLKWSFGYSGAVLWNWLPSELRKSLTLTRFNI